MKNNDGTERRPRCASTARRRQALPCRNLAFALARSAETGPSRQCCERRHDAATPELSVTSAC
eukprot:4978063-Pyramimonas_sp.AAC.1